MADIVLYTRMFCGFCSAARRLLKDKGVAFEEIDVTMKPALRAEMEERSGGGRTFPQIIINGRPIGGCEDLYALETSGELDRLLAESGERS